MSMALGVMRLIFAVFNVSFNTGIVIIKDGFCTLIFYRIYLHARIST